MYNRSVPNLENQNDNLRTYFLFPPETYRHDDFLEFE